MNEAATPTAPPATPQCVDLCRRTHTLTPPRGLFGRTVRWVQDSIEAGVAKVSRQGDPMIYDNGHFPWVRDIEADWRKVRAELDQVMTFRDQIPSFQDILKEVGTIQADDQWKTFFLAGIGMDCRESAARCPETMRVLAKIPGMKTAFFSILSPHKHIPAHRGAFNGVLRLHLALLVPSPVAQCRIRIGDQIRHWEEGRSLIFDDTFNHEVWNDTEGYRVVLFVDFARPLRQPFHWLNETFLGIGAFAPFLREAGAKQKKWEKNFYQRK